MEKEIIARLQDEYRNMIEIYRENGKQDYDAGIVEGLKRALEIIETAS